MPDDAPDREVVRRRTLTHHLRMPHKPTPLDDRIWREMMRLYPNYTQGIPRENRTTPDR
jgi:hypothetical protein